MNIYEYLEAAQEIPTIFVDENKRDILLPLVIGVIALFFIANTFINPELINVVEDFFVNKIEVPLSEAPGSRELTKDTVSDGIPNYGATVYVNFIESNRVYRGEKLVFNVEVEFQNAKGYENSEPYYYIFVTNEKNKIIAKFPEYAIAAPSSGQLRLGWKPCSYNTPLSGINPFGKNYQEATCSKNQKYYLPDLYLDGRIKNNLLLFTYNLTEAGKYRIYVMLFDKDYSDEHVAHSESQGYKKKAITVETNDFYVDSGRRPDNNLLDVSIKLIISLITSIIAIVIQAILFLKDKNLHKHKQCIWLINILLLVILFVLWLF